MISYFVSRGAKDGVGSDAFDILPEDAAMGTLPGWGVMIDPEYSDTAASYNRANDTELTPYSGNTPSQTSAVLDQFPNGEPAFLLTDAENYYFTPDVAFPQSEWTVFAVVEAGTRSDVNNSAVVTALPDYAAGTGSADTSIQAGWTASVGAVCIWGQTSIGDVDRLEVVSSPGIEGTPALLVFSASPGRGYTIRINGTEASSGTPLQPLTTGYGPGEWAMMYGARGKFGMHGMLSSDLTRPENALGLAKMEQFLMGKYAIQS